MKIIWLNVDLLSIPFSTRRMYKKESTTNQRRIIRKTSPQNSTMGKHTITKRRHSHQSKILYTQQEPTFFFFNQFEHLNTTTTRLKHTSFRPLATSTPCDIEQSSSFNTDSPHSIMRHQRPFLTPPVFSSTPKQTRSQSTKHGRSTSSVKRKLPVVISQRRLQFTSNSQSFVRHSNDESKRLTMKNIKIWLL